MLTGEVSRASSWLVLAVPGSRRSPPLTRPQAPSTPAQLASTGLDGRAPCPAQPAPMRSPGPPLQAHAGPSPPAEPPILHPGSLRAAALVPVVYTTLTSASSEHNSHLSPHALRCFVYARRPSPLLMPSLHLLLLPCRLQELPPAPVSHRTACTTRAHTPTEALPHILRASPARVSAPPPDSTLSSCFVPFAAAAAAAAPASLSFLISLTTAIRPRSLTSPPIHTAHPRVETTNRQPCSSFPLEHRGTASPLSPYIRSSSSIRYAYIARRMPAPLLPFSLPLTMPGFFRP